MQTHLLPIFLPHGVGKGNVIPSKTTLLIIIISVGFFVGVSFSSVYAGIPWDNSEIANNAITSEKIKNRQVKNPDIRGSTIKSGKIKDGTILFADINQNACATNEMPTKNPTAKNKTKNVVFDILILR